MLRVCVIRMRACARVSAQRFGVLALRLILSEQALGYACMPVRALLCAMLVRHVDTKCQLLYAGCA